jgi:hypothetical protein
MIEHVLSLPKGPTPITRIRHPVTSGSRLTIQAMRCGEYLAVLDEAAFGDTMPVVPKFISAADPALRWTGPNGELAFFAYCTNYLVDLKTRRHHGPGGDHCGAAGRGHRPARDARSHPTATAAISGSDAGRAMRAAS